MTGKPREIRWTSAAAARRARWEARAPAPEGPERPRLRSPPEPEVLYEDARVLCIAKPAGLAVLPERFEPGPTLRDWLAGRLGHERPDIVHRLDKGTSGVMVVAKDKDAARDLSRQFERRLALKEYLALVTGAVAGPGACEAPIRESSRRGVYEVHRDGRPSATAWEVEARHGAWTLLRVFPRTGRTHQIRVHLAHAGFPLAVDPLYGTAEAFYLSQLKRGYRPAGRRRGEVPLVDRPTLHAHRLSFQAPGDARAITVEAPLPKDLRRLLALIEKFART